MFEKYLASPLKMSQNTLNWKNSHNNNKDYVQITILQKYY